MKTIYCWETMTGSGSFPADSDEEALERVPKDYLIVYKEDDTTDGLPFIIVGEVK